MTERMERRLLDLKARQQAGEHMLCPRCGADTMKEPIHLPVVKMEDDVPRRRAEVRGDGLGGTFPAYAGGFNLDTESLVFHGVRSFRLVTSFSGGAFCPPRPA